MNMTQAINLSKSKILNQIQCPRRLWLEQYNPELEEPSVEMDTVLDNEAYVADIAKRLFSSGQAIHINSRRGLRSAIDQTHAALAENGNTPIFDATFEFDGVQVQVDILDRSNPTPKAIEVKCADEIVDSFIDDCAIQAWTMEQLGMNDISIAIAHAPRSAAFENAASFSDVFTETDVTAQVRQRATDVARIADAARAVLASLEQPRADVGDQCTRRYPCPFLDYCAAGT